MTFTLNISSLFCATFWFPASSCGPNSTWRPASESCQVDCRWRFSLRSPNQGSCWSVLVAIRFILYSSSICFQALGSEGTANLDGIGSDWVLTQCSYGLALATSFVHCLTSASLLPLFCQSAAWTAFGSTRSVELQISFLPCWCVAH